MHNLPADRIARGATTATLTYQGVDQAGEPADPGTLTVGITRGDGTTVTAPGTPTAGTGTAPRTITIPGTELRIADWLTATWSTGGTPIATTITEVAAPVGTVAEIKASERSLAGVDTVSLLLARRRAEDMFTDALGRGLVERFYSERLSGDGTDILPLSWPDLRTVRYARILDTNGAVATTLTPAELASIPTSPPGLMVRSNGEWPCGYHNIEVGYLFGMRAIPSDLRAALWHALRAEITRTNTGIPDRAIAAQTIEGMSYQLATPGLSMWITGIPTVDEAIRRHRFIKIGIA